MATAGKQTGTAFILALQSTPDATLRAALESPAKLKALATKYGQRIEWVEYDIRHWLARSR